MESWHRVDFQLNIINPNKGANIIKKKRNTQYIKFGKLELSLGNGKIGDNTTIFNMGSAHDCPSRRLGKCKLGDDCYAWVAENRYKACRPYRDRQKAYWKSHTSVPIAWDIVNALKSRSKRIDGKLVPLIDHIKYFRFNESGDFYSQEDVKKLSNIALILLGYGITTYGYTARGDLDFTNVGFLVKGSSHNNGNNGKCIASIQARKASAYSTMIIRDRVYTVCPGDCSTCDLCKIPNKLDIVFPLH